MNLNLSQLCEVDNTSQVDRVKQSDLLKWKTKFTADVMDLCSVELVQIEGISMTEEAAPPTEQEGEIINPVQTIYSSRLNMYMLMFTRPKLHEKTYETDELFKCICQTTLIGLPQTAQF